MKDALAKGAQVGSAECAVTQERCGDALTRAERTLAEILADVLRAYGTPADGHFFEQLGADSLGMAKVYARVRNRGDLGSVCMKDIYRPPTIRTLAAALAGAAPKPVQPPGSAAIEAATSTSAREYLLCGALQALFFLAYSYVAVVGIAWSSRWVSSGSSAVEACRRLVLASSAGFLPVCAVPIAAKWVLIGRWKTQQIRLSSLAYVRLWIVKTLIRASPAARMFVGTPVYLLYLRALGARIGPGVVIFSPRVPVCTDLLTIGAGTVIRKEAMLRSEEHTSELQSPCNLVCRLLLEKKKNKITILATHHYQTPFARTIYCVTCDCSTYPHLISTLTRSATAVSSCAD